MPANLSFDSYLAGRTTKLDTPNWLGGWAKVERISASSLLPGNKASTCSGVIPSLRPFISGAPARVIWQAGLSCPSAFVVWAGDGAEVGLLFGVDCEPVVLYALQATDTAISKDMMVRNGFMNCVNLTPSLIT